MQVWGNKEFHSQHYNKQHVFWKNILRRDRIILFNIRSSFKINQKDKKGKIIDCDFKNVSNSYRLSQSWENKSTIGFLKIESDISTLLNPILQLFHAMTIILGFLKT